MTLLLLFCPMRPWWCRASHKANACLRFNLSIPMARNPRVPKFYLTEWRLHCVPLWPGENFPFHVILVIGAALDDMEMGRKALRTSPYPLPESLHCESFSPWNQPCSWFPYLDVPCSVPLEYSPASPLSDGESSLVFKTQLKKPSPHTEMIVCFFVQLVFQYPSFYSLSSYIELRVCLSIFLTGVSSLGKRVANYFLPYPL